MLKLQLDHGSNPIDLLCHNFVEGKNRVAEHEAEKPGNLAEQSHRFIKEDLLLDSDVAIRYFHDDEGIGLLLLTALVLVIFQDPEYS